MIDTPEIECPNCKGEGRVETGNMERGPAGIGFEAVDCPACNGKGWRAMTPDEEADAAEAQHSAMSEGEPPVSMQEAHEAAWKQKQELRR